MQGLPLVYLILHFTKIFFFFFFFWGGGGGGICEADVWVQHGSVRRVMRSETLNIHRPGWRFWLCPVELANVPGWQMTTRHTFLRLGPNPRVINDKTVICLQTNAVRKQAHPRKNLPFFAFGCRRWPCRQFSLQWALNLAIQRRRTKLKWPWKIAQSCRSQCSSPPVSAITFPTVALVLVHRTGTLSKGYPLSKLQNCCQKGKCINLVSYSCLKHANEMLLGDPQQADQRTQSLNFSIVNHQPPDGTAQAPSFLPYMQACGHQSSTSSPLSGTNKHTLVR